MQKLPTSKGGEKSSGRVGKTKECEIDKERESSQSKDKKILKASRK